MAGIVLVRRAIEPGHGLWVFPGGYVDRGEDVRLAAVREAREEAGIDVRLDGLVGIYSYPGSTPVVIVYRGGVARRRARRRRRELRDPQLRRRRLPWNELAFRSTREALRDYLAAVA